MTLAQFLTALDGKDILITVSDVNGDIIKFYAGTTALEDALEARTIAKIKLTGASAISVILEAAEP